jgi:hypothetical protein
MTQAACSGLKIPSALRRKDISSPIHHNYVIVTYEYVGVIRSFDGLMMLVDGFVRFFLFAVVAACCCCYHERWSTRRKIMQDKTGDQEKSTRKLTFFANAHRPFAFS